MSGSEFNYKYGNKAQWRREVWNRIKERVTVRSRDALVLYLAGAQDLDRDVALRKGFSAQNLVAVERDSKSLRALRERQTLTIDGDIVKVVRDWPRDRKAHVIFADFCGDLDWNNGPLIGGLVNAGLAGAVVALNFMRGRGKASGGNSKEFGTKHRGEHALHQYYGVVLHRWCGFSLEEISRLQAAFPPALLSYKSISGQVFDSAVFINLATDDGTDHAVGSPVRQRIAAVMAHRTRRLSS